MRVRLEVDKPIVGGRAGQILDLPRPLAMSLIRTGQAVEHAIQPKQENAARQVSSPCR